MADHLSQRLCQVVDIDEESSVIFVYELETEEIVNTLNTPDNHRADHLNTSRDGRWLVASIRSRGVNFSPETLAVWDISSNNNDAYNTSQSAVGTIQALTISQDSRLLATIERQTTFAIPDLVFYDLDTLDVLRIVPINTSIGGLEFSPDGRTLVTFGTFISLWRVTE